jgi:pimeloyl-ACP methyl ester carboxylesterase
LASEPSSERNDDDDFARFADFPGARAPDRRRDLDSHGLRLSVTEWGDLEAPGLLLAHGGFDFSATYSAFAPLLAAGGWRVVSWDQRGHGDSEHAALYSWDADLRDALCVLDSIGPDPVPMIGHSKGGSVLTQLTHACPHRVTHLVNIDGVPTRKTRPDVADHERTKLLASELADWLDHRRRTASLLRKPGTLEELATRRGRMNPRLSHEWLGYLATVGAQRDADGWRWKIDASMRFGGFGPWHPDWELQRMPGLSVPLLGILATVSERMGWDTRPKDVEAYLPPGGRMVPFEDCGHFVHIEKPREVADLVLDFLGQP